jgi:hypothetical protein
VTLFDSKNSEFSLLATKAYPTLYVFDEGERTGLTKSVNT